MTTITKEKELTPVEKSELISRFINQDSELRRKVLLKFLNMKSDSGNKIEIKTENNKLIIKLIQQG